MKNKTPVIRFLYASSEASSDVLYLSGVFVPDPFLSVLVNGKAVAVVNQLEFGRVRAQSRYDKVLSLETVRAEAAEQLQLEKKQVGPAELMRFFVSLYGAKTVEAPPDFPAGLYAELQACGVDIRVAKQSFFPSRAIKTDAEARAIRQGNRASAAGIRAAEAVLRASEIKGRRLFYKGRTLTSEGLRTIIDRTCLGKGALPKNTIVACGSQACDPHESGHGPLRPGELIIVDVFPRLQASGYHGDMTRTFLKGRANDRQRALVGAVREAQQAALAKVKAGVAGATVHRAAEAVFRKKGFPTERRGDAFTGFIHSTGHGLGLDVHEAPRVGPSVGGARLRRGHVITIEPGLYYPGLGGCRIEDVVRVTTDGCEKLSSLHYRWEL